MGRRGKKLDAATKLLRSFEKTWEENRRNAAKFAADHRRIAVNARRAKYFVEHWDDEQNVWGSGRVHPLSEEVASEVGTIRWTIEELMKNQPELREKLALLHKEMGTKEFWENLADNMVGTKLEVCGLGFKQLTYISDWKPLWELEVDEPSPNEEVSPDVSSPPPMVPYASQSTLPPPQLPPPVAPPHPKQPRKWGCHPIGCFGRLLKFFLKLLLPIWLLLFVIHLWSPPAGDAPKPEVEATPDAGQKPVTEAEAKKGALDQEGSLAVGTRVVAKKVVPVYRLNAEKKPVVAGRVPPGGVLEVTGAVNAKVVRVSVELPNGKTAKGMAKVADLE